MVGVSGKLSLRKRKMVMIKGEMDMVKITGKENKRDIRRLYIQSESKLS